MTLTVFEELEQRSEAWYAARAGVLTASAIGRMISISAPGADAYQCPECAEPAHEPCVSLRNGATIKTVHPGRTEHAKAQASIATPVLTVASNDTSRALITTLAAERITGHVEETPVSSAMWRGIEEEPIARDFYSEHYEPAHEVGFMVRDFDGYALGYSPDGLVGDQGLIEIKSRAQKKHVETVLADDVPAENMAQLQCGLLVSGRKWCDYISFSGGMALYVKRVYPDPAWQAALIAAAQTFEASAAEIVERYTAATQGLPITERTPDYDNVELKL